MEAETGMAMGWRERMDDCAGTATVKGEGLFWERTGMRE